MTTCCLLLLISGSVANAYQLFPYMYGLILIHDSGENAQKSVPTTRTKIMGFKGKQPVLYKLIILNLIILGYGVNESIPVAARSKS